MAGRDLAVGLADGSVVALVAGMTAGVVWAVGRAAGRDGMTVSSVLRLRLGVSAAIAVWLSLAAVLARRGWLSHWDASPPRLVMLPAVVLVAMIVLNRLPRFARLLSQIPSWWPVAAQTFRVGVELVLIGYYTQDLMPRQLTLEGRNLDLLVGATAPVLSLLIARGRAGRGLVLAWNVLGLASLVNVAFLAATSVPGPLHRDWPGDPLTVVAQWPAVWIPAFLLPLAVVLHMMSIRRTLTPATPTVTRERVPA